MGVVLKGGVEFTFLTVCLLRSGWPGFKPSVCFRNHRWFGPIGGLTGS